MLRCCLFRCAVPIFPHVLRSSHVILFYYFFLYYCSILQLLTYDWYRLGVALTLPLHWCYLLVVFAVGTDTGAILWLWFSVARSQTPVTFAGCGHMRPVAMELFAVVVLCGL